MKPTPPAFSMLLDRARAWAAWALAELRLWFSPRTNPFVAWARATTMRAGAPWRLVLTMAALWAWALALSGDWAATPDDTTRDIAGDAALLWIGLALVAAFSARLTRCPNLLRVEVMKNRFEPLQLLPLESARRAWLLCAPVTQFASLVCSLALPALAWGAGSRMLAFHDVVGLLFLMLVASWGAPLWRPHQWRAQLTKSGAGSASDGFVAPVSDPSLSSAGAFLVLVALGLAGVGAEAPIAYWDGLPAHLRATGANWWLSWPLFAARWLTEAQPFFGFALPPILLLLPVWVASVHNTILRLGAVTALEPYWTPPRERNWQRARRIQIYGLCVLLFGLLWPGAIGVGWLGSWFFGAARSPAWALAVWWIIALFLGVFNAAARWKSALTSPPKRAPLQQQMRRARREMARPLLFAGAAFAGACVAGWVWPLGAEWRQILPSSLAVAATWLGASLATTAGQRLPRFAKAFAWLNTVWFYGGPLLFVALNWLNVDLRPWTPQIYFLSPWTLWWTLRQPAIADFALFWPAIFAHGFLIAASALVVWRARQTVIANVLPGESSAPTLREQWSVNAAPSPDNGAADAATAPGTATDDDEDDEAEAAEFSKPDAGTAVTKRAPLRAPGTWLVRVLDWQSRFHNPLLQLETRRVVGNEIEGTFFLARLSSALVAFVLLVILPAWGLYTGAFPFVAAAVTLAIALLVWCVLPLNGIEGTSRCYDHDRVDGSLQMLFLTPLTEREIAIGKIGPFLTRAALLMAFYSPLWLMGLLPALIFHQPVIVMLYLLAPLFSAGFALRIAAVSHWMALKKRDIGSSRVPSMIVLGAIIAVPTEALALFVGVDGGALTLTLALLGLSLLFVGEAALLWWLSLRQLRWRRFLDAPVGR